MPSIQKRVVSVAEEIATLQARLTKLESFPPSGMQLLATGGSSVPITNITATTNTAFATTTNFQLLRPVPIWVVSTCTIGTSTITVVQTEMATNVGLCGDGVPMVGSAENVVATA